MNSTQPPEAPNPRPAANVAASTTPLHRTPLYAAHQRAGARFVPFAGYTMPVQYDGVIEEHLRVRRAVGLFDVSHMGEIVVRGPNAVDAVNRLVSNDLRRIGPGRAQYTLLCAEDGGIVDDLIAYFVDNDEVFLCVNASTRLGDFAWIQEHLESHVVALDESDAWAQIAVQGPLAIAVVTRALANESVSTLRPFRFLDSQFEGQPLRIASTGYTGSGGVELYVGAPAAEALWEKLLDVGASAGAGPVGLGARDTLRLEMGYCLYGSDIDRTTTPLEAGLDWVVRLDKSHFIGQDALKRQAAAGVTRRLVGFGVKGREIARGGHKVFTGDGSMAIGRVTSGTRTPSLERPIGLAYVDVQHAALGTALAIDIRGKKVPAEVEPVPFYRPAPKE